MLKCLLYMARNLAPFLCFFILIGKHVRFRQMSWKITIGPRTGHTELFHWSTWQISHVPAGENVLFVAFKYFCKYHPFIYVQKRSTSLFFASYFRKPRYLHLLARLGMHDSFVIGDRFFLKM